MFVSHEALSDIKDDRDIIEKKLRAYYVNSDNKVDFSMIKDNKLLVKNMLCSGVLLFIFEYFNHFYIFQKNMYSQSYSVNLKQVFDDEKNTFLICLQLIFKVLFRDDVDIKKLENEEKNWLKSIIDSKNILKDHIEEMAEFLDVKHLSYSYSSFLMVPNDYGETVQNWGPCVWFLRMFIIFHIDLWKKNNVIPYFQMFLTNSILFLPCIHCTMHVETDYRKKAALILIIQQLNSEQFNDTAIVNEMYFHKLVSEDVGSNSNINVNDLYQMYKDCFTSCY